MKYICIFVCLVVIGVTLVFCPRIGQSEENAEFLRIHIRANSNLQSDQDVKYMIRDEIVEFLIPVLAECQTKQDAENKIQQNFFQLERVADEVLQNQNKTYSSTARLSNEYFPTRAYGDLVLEGGNYDALILDLGEGEGDNWWCVVYPAFCFIKSKNSTNDKYISKIWEIINNR